MVKKRADKTRATARKTVQGQELSLDDWLAKLDHRKGVVFPDYAFPTDEMREEYLATIHERDPREVKQLIRRFLIHSCTTGADVENFRTASNAAYLRCEQFYRMSHEEPAWEGITWVMDFLNDNPRRAIEVIEAYFITHVQLLDRGYWWERLYDAIALIRAVFIEVEHPRDLLLTLGGHRFERLICSLYTEMGYNATLTQTSHDGGVDVRAYKASKGETVTVLIQCKCVKGTVGVGTVRELHSAIENEKVSKGVLVAASRFSRAASNWARDNPRLELIDVNALITMLNANLSPTWPNRIEWHTHKELLGGQY